MAAAGKFEPFLEDGDEDFESYIERFEHFLRVTQAVMDEVLGGPDKVACYLDDVLIAGESFEECWEKVESVMTRFKKRGIKLRKEKCKFFETSVAYLGHVLDANGIRPSDDKENRSWLKAAGAVLDGSRVENKGPLFRDTREPTSTSTPTRLNDQDQPASNLTSPAAESAGPSTEPSPGLLHDSGPTLDSGPHNGDPSGQSTPQLRRSTRLRRPTDRYVP
ncbi:hypothetical protein MTO96_001826 [Rhipicephalus appendiculatus]